MTNKANLGDLYTSNNDFDANVTIGIGNSSVNVHINSTFFTGTSNNASYLGGTAAASYQLNSTLAANVATMTANNANYLGGLAAAGYANLSVATFTTSVNVGANVRANTTAIRVGNTLSNTIIGNSSIGIGNSSVSITINSTTFTGTANNSSYLGGTAAASYQLNSTLAANVATMTANNANYLGGTAAASYQLNSTLAANVATMTANNANYLGGLAAAGYANLSVATFSTSVNVGANVRANTTSIRVGNTLSNTIIGNSSIGIGNGSVSVTINSTTFTGTANNSLYLGGTAAASYQLNSTLAANVATMTANNASYLGGVAAAGYVVDADLDAYQTEAGLAANVATLTANNSSYLGGTAAASYQLNSTLAANVATMTANNSTYFNGHAEAYYANVTNPSFSTSIAVGSNVSVTTTTIGVGNSTANMLANSIIVKVANSTGTANLQPTQLTVGTSVVNTTVIAAGANAVINTTGFFMNASPVLYSHRADQTITGGAIVTAQDLGVGNTSTSPITMDMGSRPQQKLAGNGAFTLAPGSNTGSALLFITNGTAAGSITTSGWTWVAGDSFTTTSGHKFVCHCSVHDDGSLMVVQAMQ